MDIKKVNLKIVQKRPYRGPGTWIKFRSSEDKTAFKALIGIYAPIMKALGLRVGDYVKIGYDKKLRIMALIPSTSKDSWAYKISPYSWKDYQDKAQYNTGRVQITIPKSDLDIPLYGRSFNFFEDEVLIQDKAAYFTLPDPKTIHGAFIPHKTKRGFE